MGLSFLRTIILYICVVVAIRLMGKRQLGELQPSELVVAFMISDLASVPMQSNGVPILDGIVPIFTLVMLEFLFSIIIMKSEKLRKIFTGNPMSLIYNQKINEKNLAKLRLNIDDLLEHLRLAGYNNISEVNSAILETNGQVSIIPKEDQRPLTPKDLDITPTQTHLPHTIIADGKLRAENLKGANVSEKWLKQKLSKYNISDYKDVFYMSVTDDKEIFLQIKEKK